MQVIAADVTALWKYRQQTALRGIRTRLLHETHEWPAEQIQVLLYELASEIAQRHESITRVIEGKR